MTNDPYAVLGEGRSPEERDAHLTGSVQQLTGRRRSIISDHRFLLSVAAGLMTFGLCLILVGWLGASHSIRIEEQVPYLISGGLAGVALSIIGAVCLLAHWLTALIRQTREGQVEILNALVDIRSALEREDRENGSAPSIRAQRPLRGSSRR